MRKLTTLALAATMAACGGGGDDTPTGTTPTLDLALSVSTLSVQQGASGTATVTITRGGGLTANVDLSVEGAPTGVTTTLTPASLGSGVTSSSLSINVAAGAAVATTNLVVRAKSTGVADKTAAIALSVTAAPASGFTLSASPASVPLTAGATGTSTINVTRTGTFSGAVALTVSGAPAGVTATLNPTSATGATSTLTLATAANTVAGTYPITVSGTGTGAANASTTVSLVVTAPPTTGAFTLAASAVAGSITQGGSGTSTITVTRTGAFTAPVDLTVTGAPTGVAATLSPTSVIATTSTLTIATAGNTTPGNYTLTITGTGTGVSNATTTVAFTVAQATGGSGNVTFTFCAANAPVWLAAQDGSAGSWTRVTPGSNNDFRFNIASSTGGVAYVTAGTNGAFTLSIVHATQAELIAQGTGFCPGGTTKTLTGSVAGLAAGDASVVTLGGASASTSSNGPFILNNVPSGVQDLLASDFAQTFNGTSLATTVKKIIIRRNLNLAANAVIPTLDFSAAEAFTPATATITLANGGSDFLSSSSLYFTANGSAGGFATDLSSSAARTYYGFPAAQQQAGDLHAILAQAIVISGSSTTQIRSATQYFKDLANKTLTFGPIPNTPTITAVATTPVVRMRAQVVVQSEYNKSFVISYGQSNPSRSVVITLTSGYLGGSPSTIDFTMPDLSGVAGWDNNWGLRALTSTTWFTSFSGWTFTGSSTSPVDAGVILTGTKLGSITT